MADITPPPAAATAVVDKDADVNAAISNATDDVNSHTPEPVQPPVVENVPAPSAEVAPTEAAPSLAELHGVVTGLATTVATLVQTVTGLVTKDDAPGAVPWTHRGGAR